MKIVEIPVESSCIVQHEVINTHLTKPCLKIMSFINRLSLGKKLSDNSKRFLLKISLMADHGKPDIFLWNEKIRQQIMESCRESNEMISRYYLNGEDLF